MRNRLKKKMKKKLTTNHPRIKVSRSVIEQIRNSIGAAPAETGGMLGGNRNKNLITHFHLDEMANMSWTTYSPNTDELNEQLQVWRSQGTELMGFVHSHPGFHNHPSGGDHVYAQAILSAIPSLKALSIPIVTSAVETGKFDINWFTAEKKLDRLIVRRAEIEIVEDTLFNPVSVEPREDKTMAIPLQFPVYRLPLNETRVSPSEWKNLSATYERVEGHPWVNTDASFERVQDAYDLKHLARSRMVVVGTGGAANWVEEMARCGVGEFVLIDPDIVSETNLATQQTYRRDIGRSKVEVIAERINDINPNARVETIPQSLDDLSDVKMHELLSEPLRAEYRISLNERQIQSRPLFPASSLLCGFTDSFSAQARINRLALQFGIPSLCAQLYREGLAAELTFTHPDFTSACHRCILASRYQAFLDDGYQNDVTSHGTPIFATSRVNATKGYIALGLLHADSPHKRWKHVRGKHHE
ncbi:MAG: ThiF family adenylyltransferase [Planctomycetaceae bacterium]